ncbi:MAG: UDP-glucose/GDP-mannose dehydrogenase family protein [Tatlockia sp.]|jgi:UDPglucose 6-dehydrogenase
MNISVYGAGYVGLVSAACLAQLGHVVVCADINEERIAGLTAQVCPIYEADLPELLAAQGANQRLLFTSCLAKAVQHATIHLIATGTPGLEDGSADLSQVFAVASLIAKEAKEDCIVVTKSTVPVGSGDAIHAHIQQELRKYNKNIRISVASNPEFLREGTAVYDFLHADRVILGGEESALNPLREMYAPLAAKGIPILTMSLRSAELTKYAANAMLACRISFMNQISQIAASAEANIEEIRQGMATDHRIGPHFLQAGIGYGGSCFPKDVRALVQTAKSLAIDPCLLEAIDSINALQKNWIKAQLNRHFASRLSGLTVGIWGLSFKPETNDLREASSLVACEQLLEAGVKLRLYDPVAMPEARTLIHHPSISWCESAESVFDEKLDALVIATEWSLFKKYSLIQLKNHLRMAPLFDGRNCFGLDAVREAQLASYYSVGRPPLFASKACQVKEPS